MSYIWNHSVLITGTPNGLNGKLGQTQTFNQPPEDKQEEKKKYLAQAMIYSLKI